MRALRLSPYELEHYLGSAVHAARLRRGLRLHPREPVTVGRADRWAWHAMTRWELPPGFKFTTTRRRKAA